ncbi:dispersed gene family protein 1 (DGF-1), putative, partial [Trypanosoma cruzi]
CGGCFPRRCWRVVVWRRGAAFARCAVRGWAVGADG